MKTMNVRPCGPWQWLIVISRPISSISGATEHFTRVAWGSSERAERIGYRMMTRLGDSL